MQHTRLPRPHLPLDQLEQLAELDHLTPAAAAEALGLPTNKIKHLKNTERYHAILYRKTHDDRVLDGIHSGLVQATHVVDNVTHVVESATHIAESATHVVERSTHKYMELNRHYSNIYNNLGMYIILVLWCCFVILDAACLIMLVACWGVFVE